MKLSVNSGIFTLAVFVGRKIARFLVIYRFYYFSIGQSLLLSVLIRCKGKRSIAIRKTPHRYGNSHAIREHTVLPATRQR